jgi:hypothetical protein
MFTVCLKLENRSLEDITAQGAASYTAFSNRTRLSLGLTSSIHLNHCAIFTTNKTGLLKSGLLGMPVWQYITRMGAMDFYHTRIVPMGKSLRKKVVKSCSGLLPSWKVELQKNLLIFTCFRGLWRHLRNDKEARKRE